MYHQFNIHKIYFLPHSVFMCFVRIWEPTAIIAFYSINTLRMGDVDLRFNITTVQDGWRKSAFLTHASFPFTINLIMQYIEPVSEWSCWRIFIENWPRSELNFRQRASSI